MRTTKIKHKKLSVKRVFSGVKPISYKDMDILKSMISEQEAIVAIYVGSVK